MLFNQAFLDKREAGAFLREKLLCTADLLDDDAFAPAAAQLAVLRQFRVKSLMDLGLEDMPLATASWGRFSATCRRPSAPALSALHRCAFTTKASICAWT